jgi:HD-GYP domain-containing protein (c-di-GMP phosphodiesterase class II)
MCKPGMKLGKRVYNEEGIVLLAEHVELTSPLISRLAKLGIHLLYIEDSRTDDIVIPDLLSDETRIRAMAEVRGQFRRLMDTESKKKMGHKFMDKAFRDVLKLIIDDLSAHSDSMIMLTNMSATDLYLYQHSLNVCLYSVMLGMSCGYSHDELTQIGMGALLHDVGKTKVPVDILKKPGRLTDAEYTEIKKHAEAGFRILKDEPNIPLLVAHCALQHHERLDGSGYPRGIKGPDIHEYAKWIGIIDCYDAMTSHRVYKDALLPHQAMEVLYTGSGTQFDFDKISIFRDKIAIYPIGSEVTLNTGESGVVVDLNSTYPQRPIIRILQGPEGDSLRAPYEMDLSKILSVVVSAVQGVKVAM